MQTSPSGFIQRLDRKKLGLIAELEQSGTGATFSLLQAPMRWCKLTGRLLNEVAGYGGHLTISVSTTAGAIGQSSAMAPVDSPADGLALRGSDAP